MATALGLTTLILVAAAACIGGDGGGEADEAATDADPARTVTLDRLGACLGMEPVPAAGADQVDRLIEELLQDPSDPLTGAELACRLAPAADDASRSLRDCLGDVGFGWAYEMPDDRALIFAIEGPRFGRLEWRFEKQELGWAATDVPECPEGAG